MKRPLRNLSIVVGLVLAALLLVEFAADGLQAYGTRGHQNPGDFAAPNLQGPGF